jgi:hypothetical protein
MAALFSVALVGAWGWFYVGVTPPEKSYVLHAKESLPGYQFKPMPVGEQAIETLATTNLLNGTFEGGTAGDRFMVFSASWAAKGAKQMGVLGHTPEICWVGAGFKLISMGEPAFLEVDLAGERVPLECRIFQAPDRRSLEMVAWCSVVSGQFLEEGFRFQAERGQQGESRLNQADNARIRGANSFVRALAARQPGDGTKQFVRFSTPVSGDWKESYQRLQKFSQEWLELEVLRKSVASKS